MLALYFVPRTVCSCPLQSSVCILSAVRYRRHMPLSYAETVAFDAVVVIIVAVVLPLSVLLLRSRNSTGRLSGAALLGLSMLYIGGFEHYRLHTPEVSVEALTPLRNQSRPSADDVPCHVQITSSGLRATLLDPTTARARALADMISGAAHRRK